MPFSVLCRESKAVHAKNGGKHNGALKAKMTNHKQAYGATRNRRPNQELTLEQVMALPATTQDLEAEKLWSLEYANRSLGL